MTDFDYKKYSLENLENWMHDAVSSAEASPHEIYSVIRKVVQDQYNYHKEQSQRCSGLLELLSGHRPVKLECDKDDPSPECMDAWTNFWEEDSIVEEKPNSWTIPVEFDGEDAIITLPDEVIEMKGWKDGDVLEWVSRDDGSWEIRKKENNLTTEV